MSRNLAVAASDNNPDYYFYAPIAEKFWRERGFQTLLILVGGAISWSANPRCKLSLFRAREAGAIIHFAPALPGYRTSTIAQCARALASGLPGVKDDDYLLTSDIEMLPLGPWVGGGRAPGKDFTIWYANAYGCEPTYPHWPICYLGASAKIWREVAGYPPESFKDALAACLAAAPNDPVGAWNHDERWIGERISSWHDYPNKVHFIDRHFVEGEWRLDRSSWDETWRQMNGSVRGLADAHCVRPGYSVDNWPRIRDLCRIALPDKAAKWIEDYHREWMNAK